MDDSLRIPNPETYSREEVIDLIHKALYDINSGLGMEVRTFPDGTTADIDTEEWLKRNLK